MFQAAGAPLTREQQNALESLKSAEASALEHIPLTPKEEQLRLRKGIERLVRQLASNLQRHPEELNRDLKERFGKSRADMTNEELKETYQFVVQAIEKLDIDLEELS